MSEQRVSVLDQAMRRFAEIVEEEGLYQVGVSVQVIPLTPEEAIGTPWRRDFPIVVGKERVIEASVLGTKGQAFTDSPQHFEGTLADVLNLGLATKPELRGLHSLTQRGTRSPWHGEGNATL